MDNPASIIGFKIGHALIDEIDVLPAAATLDLEAQVVPGHVLLVGRRLEPEPDQGMVLGLGLGLSLGRGQGDRQSQHKQDQKSRW